MSFSGNLDVVLRFLNSPQFEPLSECSVKYLTMKTLFLISLASAKRVSELQALSSKVGFLGDDCTVHYVNSFIAKTESIDNPIPRHF